MCKVKARQSVAMSRRARRLARACAVAVLLVVVEFACLPATLRASLIHAEAAAPRFDFHDVHCPDTQTCFAVTGQGFILVGDQAWSRWQVAARLTSDPLRAIDCDPGMGCVAVGDAGRTAFSQDGGHSWRLGPIIPEAQLLAVACPGEGRCIAVGARSDPVTSATRGLIVGSVDGGRSWQELARGLGEGLRGLSCPTSKACMAVGGRDTVIRSRDGGRSWDLLSEGSPRTNPVTISALTAVACTDADRCHVLGGTVVRGIASSWVRSTADGGDSWRTKGTGGYVNILIDLSCPSDDTCVAVGSQSDLYVTRDGAESWQKQRLDLGLDPDPNADHRRLVAISCPDAGRCLALGSGALLAGAIGGEGWVLLEGPKDDGLSRVWLPVCSRS